MPRSRRTSSVSRNARGPFLGLSIDSIGEALQQKRNEEEAELRRTQQIKQSIQSRPVTNQDIRFLNKKKCGVCLESWKEILMEGKHLVFTECGHIFCRDCAIRFASEGKRECPLCKKSLAGVNPPFRRLHMPLDPRLKKSRAD